VLRCDYKVLLLPLAYGTLGWLLLFNPGDPLLLEELLFLPIVAFTFGAAVVDDLNVLRF